MMRYLLLSFLVVAVALAEEAAVGVQHDDEAVVPPNVPVVDNEGKVESANAGAVDEEGLKEVTPGVPTLENDQVVVPINKTDDPRYWYYSSASDESDYFSEDHGSSSSEEEYSSGYDSHGSDSSEEDHSGGYGHGSHGSDSSEEDHGGGYGHGSSGSDSYEESHSSGYDSGSWEHGRHRPLRPYRHRHGSDSEDSNSSEGGYYGKSHLADETGRRDRKSRGTRRGQRQQSYINYGPDDSGSSSEEYHPNRGRGRPSHACVDLPKGYDD